MQEVAAVALASAGATSETERLSEQLHGELAPGRSSLGAESDSEYDPEEEVAELDCSRWQLFPLLRRGLLSSDTLPPEAVLECPLAGSWRCFLGQGCCLRWSFLGSTSQAAA